MAIVMRVLVFDSDLSARRGLERLLLAAGYDVRAFADSREFLHALGSEEADGVVLDAGMTDLPLDDLLVIVSDYDFTLPIIIVTTHDDRETRRRAEKMNAVAFFRKPVDGPALLDAIDWALQRRLNT